MQRNETWIQHVKQNNIQFNYSFLETSFCPFSAPCITPQQGTFPVMRAVLYCNTTVMATVISLPLHICQPACLKPDLLFVVLRLAQPISPPSSLKCCLYKSIVDILPDGQPGELKSEREREREKDSDRARKDGDGMRLRKDWCRSVGSLLLTTEGW